MLNIKALLIHKLERKAERLHVARISSVLKLNKKKFIFYKNGKLNSIIIKRIKPVIRKTLFQYDQLLIF